MLTARAARSASTVSEMSDWSIMSALAQRASTGASVGENAVLVLKARKRSPNFVDYLFVAFNTSTAFSPTDAPVLARWAKALMMLQSLISLTVLALLAARAVNIL